MAAYNLTDRFSRDSKCYRIYDPGAYQYEESNKINPDFAPFLSNTPRNTSCSRPLWTHAIYDAGLPSNIPNCTSMMSKIPRFPYEALSKEDLDEILCKCGFPTSCQCPVEGESYPIQNIVCQGKMPKHIIKGVPPRIGDSGLSAPSKGDKGFQIYRDGSQKRLKEKVSEESPPFYDARVIEATMFYQGCKWSKWSSARATKPLEQSPGPADYTLENQPNENEKKAEQCRSQKRKESKQYRFIEMVQMRNILENAPGPATYSPMSPKGVDLQELLGPKAERFPTLKYEVHPGPADYNLKRDFDLPAKVVTPCHAVLPEPPCFGMKAQRFKTRKEEGPSPASYCATYKPCHIQICSKAPFGSAAARFKSMPLERIEENEISVSDYEQQQNEKLHDPCPNHTWEFKSKTMRLKPLLKCFNEPSPADFLPEQQTSKKPLNLQYLAPFCSSNGRFIPWCNWISVFGKLVTPGPGYYNAETPHCNPAVNSGPLYRDRRFRSPTFETPAPNAYIVGGGIENILNTHNQKLKNNIKEKGKLYCSITPERKVLTLEEKETLLINKSIALCEEFIDKVSTTTPTQDKKCSTMTNIEKDKKKLLRFFLYKHQMPICT